MKLEHFMCGFDVEIKFKSLYNSLLIPRVSKTLFSVRSFIRSIDIHYHLDNFSQLINA